MSMLTVAVGLTSASIGSISKYSEAARENSRARSAAEDMVWALREYPFERLFADFNEAAADDLPGAPGNAFDVPGLEPTRDDPDGRVGRIVLSDDPANGTVLREDRDVPELGLPFDLNLDGVVDAMDHSGDYRMIPVRVVVEWRGRLGDSQVVLDAVIGQW